MTANYVAQMILSQLGGQAFAKSAGIKNMVYAANSLTMKCHNGRFLFVRFNADGLYTVERFRLINKAKVGVVISHGVHSDNLCIVATDFLGLTK